MTTQLFIQVLFLGVLAAGFSNMVDFVAALYFTHVTINRTNTIIGVVLLFAVTFAGLYVANFVYLQLTGHQALETLREFLHIMPDPIGDAIRAIAEIR